MKFTKTITLSLVIILAAIINPNAFSQEKGNGNVVKQTRETAAFRGIEVGGAIDVKLEKGDRFLVVIETDENLQDKVFTSVSDSILTITMKNIKNPKKLEAYVVLPELTYLKASGASDVEGVSLFEPDRIAIFASGAADVYLNIESDWVETTISGAADVILSGTAGYNNITVSGAGSLNAKGLVTKKANCYVTGAGTANLNVTTELQGSVSNSSSYSNIGEPRLVYISRSENGRTYTSNYYTSDYQDSVKVKIGRLEVNYYEDNDSVKIKVGNRELKIDDDGNVSLHRCKPARFNGHWAGVEMAVNGYVNSDFNMNFPKTYEYLDLNMIKSYSVYINFFEQNVALSKNQKWGLVTGLGTYWNNYRFSNNTRLNSDSSHLIGYVDQGISIRKTKLTNWYLTVPLLFEFQTNSRMKKNSFHIAVGMIAGLRLTTHTKTYYDERNKDFNVTLYNPETDKYETVFTATSPDYSKTKDFDDYYLQPFKFDATVRIGWGFINLFATYSVNEMFRKGKGPEVYPWAAGITFVNF
jgi:hypothetical protein